MNPTLTKDNLLEKLKEVYDLVDNAEFGKEECQYTIDPYDLGDLSQDIDDARLKIRIMQSILEKDPGLKEQDHWNGFMSRFDDIDKILKDAEYEKNRLL